MRNNTLSRAELADSGNTLNIHYGDVLIKYHDTLNCQTEIIPYINMQSGIKRNDDYLKDGDVIIADTAEDETVGKATEIYEVGTKLAVSGLHTIPCRSKYSFAPHFLGFYLNSPVYHNQLYPLMQGIKVTSISKSNISTTYIRHPSVKEQNKIAEMLSLIDKKIELQNKLIEILKSYKRGLLSTAFPKENECVPVLRFGSFNDEWRNKNLRDMGDTYTGLSGKCKEDFGHGNARYITYLNVFTNPISNPNMTEPIEIDNKQNEVQYGDILFTTSSETPDEVGMSSVWLDKTHNTYLNSFCFGFRPKGKSDKYYLAYMFRSNVIRQKIVYLAQGISRYNISKNKMMDIEIALPSLAEQEKIGAFFRCIDGTISVYQKKLELLQSVKVGLIQKMFI